MTYKLLDPTTDPLPAVREEGAGTSPFLIISEHAGKAVPCALGDMGVPSEDWQRHIATDIGALDVARVVAASLDATLIHQRYSRLVVDCNRTETATSLIPETSDGTPIPANKAMTAPERAARLREIHAPFHGMIARDIAHRRAAREQVILVSIHSFTPHFGGHTRPMHVGVQFAAENPFARTVINIFERETTYVVGDNAPYPPHPTDDYSMPIHGKGLAHVMLEIRQDLLADRGARLDWGARIAQILQTAYREY